MLVCCNVWLTFFRNKDRTVTLLEKVNKFEYLLVILEVLSSMVSSGPLRELPGLVILVHIAVLVLSIATG
jgi:hypothetical protein